MHCRAARKLDKGWNSILPSQAQHDSLSEVGKNTLSLVVEDAGTRMRWVWGEECLTYIGSGFHSVCWGESMA